MATVKDEEEQKGSGLSTALGGEQPPKEEATTGTTPATPSSGPASIGAGASAPSQPQAPKQQKAGTGTFANLKSYLQAAQGGGRVAQVATQRVQKATTGAEKGISQAQKTFGQKMQAGSLARMETAGQEARGIIGTATGATYQAPQPAPAPITEGVDGGKIGINPPRLPNPYEKTVDMERFNRIDNNPPAGLELTPEQYAEIQAKKIVEPTSQLSLEQVIAQEKASQIQPAATQPQQYFTPEQQQRFAEIINAQYQGPMSLQQAGLYEPAAKKAQTAQQLSQQAQTAGGRELLLRDIFGKTRDYSRGQSKLDALLLNTSQQGVQQLQQEAQKAGAVQQQLYQTQNQLANEALQRANAIESIRSGARGDFTTARTQEEEAANAGIKAIQDNWERLPEYFKKVLEEAQTATVPSQYTGHATIGGLPSERPSSTYNLSKEEANILGLTAGQGLFGITPESIQATQLASGGELITKDQLSRQLALAQLANLDKSRSLQKDLTYTDLQQAGTKDILSSLDTTKLKAIQEENRKNMEKELGGSFSQGFSNYYLDVPSYNFLDLMKKGGYSPLEMEGLKAEGSSSDLLKQIATGKEYTPTENAAPVSSYLQKAYESIGANMNPYDKAENLIFGIKPLEEKIQKYGALDTTQIVEDDKTKARASALRELLSGIYKK
jgi:hypothetical protein